MAKPGENCESVPLFRKRTSMKNRVLRVSVQIGNDFKVFTDQKMTVKGIKTTTPRADTCEITIAGLSRTTLNTLTDYLYDSTTTLQARVEIGREGGKLSELYLGDVHNNNSEVAVGESAATFNDNSITLFCGTGAAKKQSLKSISLPKKTSLKDIAAEVAGGLGSLLDFSATDSKEDGFVHNGDAFGAIDKIAKKPEIEAYLDGNTLVVKNKRVPLAGRLIVLNKDSGMIGVPKRLKSEKPKQAKIQVQWLVDEIPSVGWGLQIQSERVQSANGVWIISKLQFDLANRDKPWYFTAEAIRYE